MIGRDIGPRLHRQHGEGFADFRRVTPDSSNAEDRLVLLYEEPLVFSLLLGAYRIGELVEAVRDDEAPVLRELPAL